MPEGGARMLVIHPDGAFEDRLVAVHHLDEVHGLVGGFVERVPLPQRAVVAFCDEDAPNMGKTLNERASALTAVLGRPVTLYGTVAFAGAVPVTGRRLATDLHQDVFDVFAGLTWITPGP